jgi:terminal uridylyltransferase
MPAISRDQASSHDSGLEARLQGLTFNTGKTAQTETSKIQPDSKVYFPPHMLYATDAQKQEYLRKQAELSQTTKLPGQQSQRGKGRSSQSQWRQRSLVMPVTTDTMPAVQATQYNHTPSSFSFHSHQYESPGGQSYQGYPQTHFPPLRSTNRQTAAPLAQSQFQQSPHQTTLLGTNAELQSPPINQLTPQSSRLDKQILHQKTWNSSESKAPSQYGARPIPRNPQLFQPGNFSAHRRGAPFGNAQEQIVAQNTFLEKLINQHVQNVGIGEAEVRQKEEFRIIVEQACREAIAMYEKAELGKADFEPNSVELQCFGSLAAGFATKASDMDLALLTPYSTPPPDSFNSPIPRLLEKKLLEMGFGARLLTRTRVPIIKVCQRPTTRLMSDLLEARSKWEDGFNAENEVDVADDINDKVTDQEEDGKDYEEIHGPGNTMRKPAASNIEEELRSFKQKKSQSLLDHYNSAKRLLRSFGGQDITPATESSEDNNHILQEVCKAFLNGLSDENLKARLLSYQSLSLLVTEKLTTPRSLNSIFSQIEGEQLASLWGSRPLTESTYKAEIECNRLIAEWQNHMNTIPFDTLAYNRNLHQAVERLKRIPSLQLLFLEQDLHEDPVVYHARTARILNELGGRDEPSEENHVLEVVKRHYLAGVKDLKIQEQLEKVVSDNEPVSLQSLMLRHRILQLTNDYEIAISKDLYNPEDQTYITEYVHLLRSGITNLSASSLVAPLNITRSTAPLIRKMRSLPDPSHMIHKPRDRYRDRLEFPKNDIGIQCDINFSAQFALHNTLLLRCYSLTDCRVKPLVLFVKHWAKLRAINTPYRGSLSSYGYVLMVLHYLVNITQPFVCPNLQHLRQELPSYPPRAEIAAKPKCNGYDVQFWRNEKEIADLADRGMLNHNKESLGSLLRGFFEYFANTGQLSTGGRGFDWGREVLSLRTQGGLLSKKEKGWVGARTVMETTAEAAPTPIHATATSSFTKASTIPSTAQTTHHPKAPVIRQEVKEIRHRYLFCIEDPFEHDHNVARTVTHNGICAIRGELRRAWRIIKSVGRSGQEQGQRVQEELMSEESGEIRNTLEAFMDEIHGILRSDQSEAAVEGNGGDGVIATAGTV